MELFDLDKAKKDVEGKTCLSCDHRERHECGSKVFQYCGIRKSNRTANGKLKIKCKDQACIMYNYVKA